LAEVVALDRAGHEVASRGGPLRAVDDPRDGAVSFVVSVPYTSEITRYAVRFRDGSSLIKHVDRRPTRATPATAAALNAAP
jgi:hypothetical protein